MTTINELNEQIQRIVTSDELNWQEKYDLIFSDRISMRVFAEFNNMGIPFEYYDPDTSHEEDVLAFASAVNDHTEYIEKIERRSKHE